VTASPIPGRAPRFIATSGTATTATANSRRWRG
jgi:hypothetical protein